MIRHTFKPETIASLHGVRDYIIKHKAAFLEGAERVEKLNNQLLDSNAIANHFERVGDPSDEAALKEYQLAVDKAAILQKRINEETKRQQKLEKDLLNSISGMRECLQSILKDEFNAIEGAVTKHIEPLCDSLERAWQIARELPIMHHVAFCFMRNTRFDRKDIAVADEVLVFLNALIEGKCPASMFFKGQPVWEAPSAPTPAAVA